MTQWGRSLFCKPEDLSLAPMLKLGMVVCAPITLEIFAVNGKHFVLSSCCVSWLHGLKTFAQLIKFNDNNQLS